MSPFELPPDTIGRRPIRLPDAHRLHGTVVEHVRLGRVGKRPAVLVPEVAERVRAADHALGRDSVDLFRDRSHEVAIAARGDVVREAVRLQVAEQLDHGQVPAGVERAAKRWMLPGAQERVGRVGVLLDALAGECLEDAGHQHFTSASSPW
jgi:hypothetical protein